MRTFHYYHAESGELHSKVFKCDASTPYGNKDAKANAPDGHLHIETTHADEKVVEHWRWRVHPETKKLLRKQ
jgi:hypothetical protein